MQELEAESTCLPLKNDVDHNDSEEQSEYEALNPRVELIEQQLLRINASQLMVDNVRAGLANFFSTLEEEHVARNGLTEHVERVCREVAV